MGNPFTQDFHDKGSESKLIQEIPKFDVQSLYTGIDKLPGKPSTKLDDGISFDPTFKGAISAQGGERLTPYKLPEVELTPASGQSTLDDLTRRITSKATDNVQKHMTSKEKNDLNDDTVKYAKQMNEYNEHMRQVMTGTGGIGLDDPPPHKPASLVKYEKAIDAEIKRIAQNLG